MSIIQKRLKIKYILPKKTLTVDQNIHQIGKYCVTEQTIALCI